jgi:3-isopropylmalate/(R)-2-methylmalate dehydratase small subunit
MPCACAEPRGHREDRRRRRGESRAEVVIDVAKQEIRFGGQTVKATMRESARDALVNGRWDAIGELLEGVPAVKETAKKLPYLAA